MLLRMYMSDTYVCLLRTLTYVSPGQLRMCHPDSYVCVSPTFTYVSTGQLRNSPAYTFERLVPFGKKSPSTIDREAFQGILPVFADGKGQKEFSLYYLYY